MLTVERIEAIAATANRGIGRTGQAAAAGVSRRTLRLWLTEGKAIAEHLDGRPPVGRRQRLLVRLHVELAHKDRAWCARRRSDLIDEWIARQDREMDEMLAGWQEREAAEVDAIIARDNNWDLPADLPRWDPSADDAAYLAQVAERLGIATDDQTASDHPDVAMMGR